MSTTASFFAVGASVATDGATDIAGVASGLTVAETVFTSGGG